MQAGLACPTGRSANGTSCWCQMNLKGFLELVFTADAFLVGIGCLVLLVISFALKRVLRASWLPMASGTAFCWWLPQGASVALTGDQRWIRTWSRPHLATGPWLLVACSAQSHQGFGLPSEPASSPQPPRSSCSAWLASGLVDCPRLSGLACGYHPGHLRAPDGSQWASAPLPCQRRSLPVVSPPSPSSPRLLATAVIGAEPGQSWLRRFRLRDSGPLAAAAVIAA